MKERVLRTSGNLRFNRSADHSIFAHSHFRKNLKLTSRSRLFKEEIGGARRGQLVFLPLLALYFTWLTAVVSLRKAKMCYQFVLPKLIKRHRAGGQAGIPV